MGQVVAETIKSLELNTSQARPMPKKGASPTGRAPSFIVMAIG